MKFHLKSIAVAIACLITACASIPGTSTVNYWEYPSRPISISPGVEQTRFLASLQACIRHANTTFPNALHRYESGLLEGAGLVITVIDDENSLVWVRVHLGEGELIQGEPYGRTTINGRLYDEGSRISVEKADIVDWYIIYNDNRIPEGNFLGKYILLKQDGLAPGDCDPTNVEFQRYRYFSQTYSFVPPGTDGWEIRGPREGVDRSLHNEGKSLDELNTLSSVRYNMPEIESMQDLVAKLKVHMEYPPESADRYTVLEHQVDAFAKKEAMCALSQQVIDDKKALLMSKKRVPMIREVQTLLCLHPYEENVGVMLNYSHRYYPGNRDGEFIDKAKKVFESLAFTKKN